jgi:hypothetical protein
VRSSAMVISVSGQATVSAMRSSTGLPTTGARQVTNGGRIVSQRRIGGWAEVSTLTTCSLAVSVWGLLPTSMPVRRSIIGRMSLSCSASSKLLHVGSGRFVAIAAPQSIGAGLDPPTDQQFTNTERGEGEIWGRKRLSRRHNRVTNNGRTSISRR